MARPGRPVVGAGATAVVPQTPGTGVVGHQLGRKLRELHAPSTAAAILTALTRTRARYKAAPGGCPAVFIDRPIECLFSFVNFPI